MGEVRLITIIKKSLLAGMLIGLGIVVNLIVPNQYIGTVLFSFALLTIIHCDLFLYTGRIGFIKNKQFSLFEWIMMFGCNWLGAAFIVMLKDICDQKILDTINAIAINKFSKSYIELFICGLLCGILMFIAVYCKNIVITIFCVSIFILSGYEHSIVDSVYFLCVPTFDNTIKFMLIILGNSLGSIIINELISTLKE